MSTHTVTITEEPGISVPDEKFKVTDTVGSQSWSLPMLDLDGIRQLDAECCRILRPTAEQLYEATLDGTCESAGDVSAPTGWFALVDWPNGHLYLVSHDVFGLSHTIASTADRIPPTRDQLCAMYQGMCDRFAAWSDQAEQEL